jgi:hypothetical protein
VYIYIYIYIYILGARTAQSAYWLSYGLDNRGIGGGIPKREKGIFCSPQLPASYSSGAHQAPCVLRSGSSLSRIKQSKYEAEHSPLSTRSTDIKQCASTPEHLAYFMAKCLIDHRENIYNFIYRFLHIVTWEPEFWSQHRRLLLGNDSANTSITSLDPLYVTICWKRCFCAVRLEAVSRGPMGQANYSGVLSLQLAVGRQTRRKSPQTVALGGGVGGGGASLTVSRCLAT